ncbi:MAG: hypothetical protein ACYC0F_12890 [Rhodanobacter sp.]
MKPLWHNAFATIAANGVEKFIATHALQNKSSCAPQDHAGYMNERRLKPPKPASPDRQKIFPADRNTP